MAERTSRLFLAPVAPQKSTKAVARRLKARGKGKDGEEGAVLLRGNLDLAVIAKHQLEGPKKAEADGHRLGRRAAEIGFFGLFVHFSRIFTLVLRRPAG